MNLATHKKKKQQKRAEKRQLKLEDEKVKEADMLEKLNVLNGQFKKIKQAKKDEKKMSSTNLK